jgi:BASS family bile acid:Na+ symporter
MSASTSPASTPGSLLWLGLCAVSLLAFAGGWAAGIAPTVFGLGLVAAMAFFALYCRSNPKLDVLTFTFWVLAFTTAAMFNPAWFQTWGSFKLSRLNTLLIQIVMFGMGATLSVADFLGALRMPRTVIIGVGLHFLVMPLLGLAIATGFGFEPEVAAGIVLIGSCSSGLAGNVMVYLARGNAGQCRPRGHNDGMRHSGSARPYAACDEAAGWTACRDQLLGDDAIDHQHRHHSRSRRACGE